LYRFNNKFNFFVCKMKIFQLLIVIVVSNININVLTLTNNIQRFSEQCKVLYTNLKVDNSKCQGFQPVPNILFFYSI